MGGLFTANKLAVTHRRDFGGENRELGTQAHALFNGLELRLAGFFLQPGVVLRLPNRCPMADVSLPE